MSEPRQTTTALITGASDGIGLELARLMAADGINLVLVARNRERLEEICSELRSAHSIQATALPMDLAKPGAAAEVHQELAQRAIPIDILVNNAGIGLYGKFEQISLAAQQQLLHLNMTTMTELTHLFGKDFVKRKSGKVLNVASTAGFVPGPFCATYYASKAYLVSLSVALANEWEGGNVTVTVLCPGPTFTGFFKRAGVKEPSMAKRKILPVMTARAVAKAGYEGMKRGQVVVIPGIMNRFFVFMRRYGTLVAMARISRSFNISISRMNRPPGPGPGRG